MEQLQRTYQIYKELILQGCSYEKAAKGALNAVFGLGNHKHIYKDEEGLPSHIYHNGCVMFFDGDIFRSIKSESNA